MLKRIVIAVTLDGLNLLGRGIGSTLAGIEESVVKAYSRRGIEHLTVAEVQRRGDAGELTISQVRTLTALEKQQARR